MSTFAWDYDALLFGGCGLLLIMIASWAFGARTDRQQNRILSFIALSASISTFMGGTAQLWDGAVAAAASTVSGVALVLLAAATTWFAGTLTGPWVLFLRGTLFRATTGTTAAAMAVALVLGPPALAGMAQIAVALAGLFLAVAAFAALRTPHAAIVTKQLRWALGAAVLVVLGTIAAAASPALGPISLLLYGLSLAYAVLQAQVLDLAIRIKHVVRNSAMAVILATVFLVVSETLESVLPVDGQAYGILAASGIAIALQPLQRFAGKLTARFLPNVEASREYLLGQREAIFRAAMEGALRDDLVTDREKRFLDALQEDLGITPAEARAIERDVSSSLA